MAIIVLLIILFIAYTLLKKHKRVSPLGTITMVTGAVKVGKTTFAVWLALSTYFKVLLRWHILRLFPKHRHDERPLLYSNIPLKVKHVRLTQGILLREERINFKSVVLIDEASLVADSQLIRDSHINEQLLLFYKLFGHFSRGGTLILDTQSIEDNHYAVKRCCSSQLYCSKNIKLPFVQLISVIEQRYSSDGTIVAAETQDIDEITKRVLVPKFVWRFFDTYCYSVFTDENPVVSNEIKADTLKTTQIVSFRPNFAKLNDIYNDKNKRT